MILTGTTFVDGSERDGVLGFIIGYQNHRKYYLITWRRNNFNLNDRGNIRGIQIWVRFSYGLKVYIYLLCEFSTTECYDSEKQLVPFMTMCYQSREEMMTH